MREIVYKRIAEVICFICHGKCCREGMVFYYSKGKIKLVKKTYESCLSFNKLTGRCGSQKDKPPLCKKWKCWTLNLISRLLKQEIWDGTFYG